MQATSYELRETSPCLGRAPNHSGKSDTHLNSQETSCEPQEPRATNYELQEPIPRLGQAPNHSGDSDLHHPEDSGPHHTSGPAAPSTLTSHEVSYELQEPQATTNGPR